MYCIGTCTDVDSFWRHVTDLPEASFMLAYKKISGCSIFAFPCFFFIIRDLLYFGGILIKINILASYYSICDIMAPGDGILEKCLPVIFLLTLLEKALAFHTNIIIIKMYL